MNTTIVKPDAKKKYAETQSLNELQKCVSADRKNTENEVESVDQTQDLDKNSSYKERFFSSNTSFVANNLKYDKRSEDLKNLGSSNTIKNMKKELEGKPTPRITIHPMITRLKIRMIPDDEVDNFMVQLVQSKIRGKFTRINVFDFDKRVTYEEPKE